MATRLKRLWPSDERGVALVAVLNYCYDGHGDWEMKNRNLLRLVTHD